MRNRTFFPRDNSDADEGELNSDEDSESTSSEGVTSDGEVDSDEDDRSDRTRSPVEETPWERGLRLARERAKKVKLLRQNDADLEEKKLKLTVVAPDPNEEDTPAAATSELGRSNFADSFWLDYYKLAVVGCTQLTGKRSLPCDLTPPSQSTMSRWRRRLLDARTRSVDASSATSPASTNCRSRASSLSSLAGSILLAVPDLIIADDSDREQQRRRRRGGGRRRGSTSSNTSSSAESHRRRSSSSRSGISSRSSTKDQKKKSRSASSASSVSSSSSSAAAFPRSRDKVHGKEGCSKRRISPRRRGLADGDQRTSWRNRRPQLSHSDQRQPPQSQPQISGYHHQQRGFTDRSRDDFGTNENGAVCPSRQNYADSNRWQDSTHRSPDRPPPMPSEKPIKRPWVADPSLKSKAPIRQRSPSPSTRIGRSRTRSPSRPSSPSATDNVGQTTTTYITSWSQSRDRDASMSPPPPPPMYQQHRGSLRRQSSKSALPDVVPAQIASSPPSRKRPAPSRRKSRSPFANIDFGNPPAPMRPSLRDHHGPPPELSFEQTVPLLAGAVNPAAPSSTKALPSASSRPGVKLKIAPRVRAAPVLPSSALDKVHRASGGGGGSGGGGARVGASPVSSATSSRGSSQSPSRQHPRRDNISSTPSQFQSEPSAAKRMRQLGYTAVSPGGFESPPSPASRPYGRSRRPDVNEAGKGRRSDQGRDGYRSRISGEFHEHVDRFSRGGYPHQPPDRYRERRQHGDDFDRHRQSFDRSRPGRFGRDYNTESHYGRSRGEERISNRSYGGRHGNRRQGRGGGSGDVHVDMVTEQRLNELRQRLTMVDDKIAELGGASAVGHR
ncbi:unnamed protein product [Mesocestoides corti]|uniref:Uncharacterized protein n=1 Tax=Mesocestoides corti TaxID=53468 RepID=A0A0R3UGU8_MESCO|nr:unnamed protein product [Mesocestoides corti]